MENVSINKELKRSALATVALALLLCGLYPVAVWSVGAVLFPAKSRGSLILDAQGKPIGSALLGQAFASAKYFHPRPSAAGAGYDAAVSGGSNLGQTSQKLMDSLKARVEAFRKENSLGAETLIPGDAVTASASGLDPEISLENAMLQVPRVAKERGLSVDQVAALVGRHLRGRALGFLGEPGVSVLKVNLALDGKE